MLGKDKKRKQDRAHTAADKDVTIAAYSRLFSTPDGKIVLADLQASFGGATFVAGMDAETCMYRTGQRSVVDLINEVKNPT